MKKIISLLVLISFSLFASAQMTMTASSNTNTNAVTQTHIATLSGAVNNFETITVQVVGTKTSGTPAGTCILYGSIDGTYYKAIGADTLTITNTATQTKFWTLDHTRYVYYKVAVVTTGTQVSTWVAYLLGRKTPRAE